MPKVVELYKEYGENKKDLIILGVATPISKNTQITKIELIKQHY